jgi:hypothetical protein
MLLVQPLRLLNGLLLPVDQPLRLLNGLLLRGVCKWLRNNLTHI